MPEYDPAALVKAAVDARKHSYSPYSHFAVGAALLAESGILYTGANIENAAYSVSNCAERTALFKAIDAGERHFVAIAIAGGPAENDGTGTLPLCAPCGVCRQALCEFSPATMPVLLATGASSYETHTLGALLPVCFGPPNLA